MKIELAVLTLVSFITFQYYIAFLPIELLPRLLHLFPCYVPWKRLPLFLPGSKMTADPLAYDIPFSDEALAVQLDEEFAISTTMS